MNASRTFVGVDVAKNQLDIAVWPSGETWVLGNDEAGIKGLIRRLRRMDSPHVVCEATGGYELPLAVALAKGQIAFSVANPRQVRDFARGVGLIEKTDRIDAGVLAYFGEVVRPQPRPLASEATQKLNGLVVRRRQLVNMITAEQNRRASAPKELRSDIQDHIAWLKRRLSLLEGELRQAIKADPNWQQVYRILRSAKGVGPVVATSLLAALPELGKLSSRQIAKLVGTAPLARDSGQFKGKRSVWGGRAAVRAVLYMAALVASRSNSVIRCFYQRLLARGKLKKVALVACMRKLLVTLNAMVRDSQVWRPEPLTT